MHDIDLVQDIEGHQGIHQRALQLFLAQHLPREVVPELADGHAMRLVEQTDVPAYQTRDVERVLDPADQLPPGVVHALDVLEEQRRYDLPALRQGVRRCRVDLQS